MALLGKFDSDGFYGALDAVVRSRQCTWKAVAEQTKLNPSTLTRLKQGKRPDVDTMAALCAWSGLRADDFIRSYYSNCAGPGVLGAVATLFARDSSLKPRDRRILVAIINEAHERMRE